jgi:hypothetical protein
MRKSLSAAGSSEGPPPAAARQRSTITAHFQRSLPPAFTPSSVAFPQALTASLQSVTLSLAFCKWYNEEIFKCTTVNEKETKVKGKLAYAVQVMKKLLPAGTMITSKPNTLPEFQAWAQKIQQLGDLAQQKVLQLCSEAHAEAIVAGTRKRKREIKPNLESMIKRVGKLARMQPEKFSSLQGAVDQANPIEPVVSMEVC